MTELRVIVTGKVQGVGFRDYVEKAAVELGLFGYVANLENGTVEVLAQGEPSLLRELVEYLHEGSSLSKVEEVLVEWGTAKVLYEDFSILV